MSFASAQRGDDVLSLQQRHLLAEMGVVRYVPRAPRGLVAPVEVSVSAEVEARQRAAPPAVPVRPAGSPVRPVPAASSTVQTAPPAASGAPGFGSRRLRFAGPAQSWPALRLHVLRAFAATELPVGSGSDAEVEVMFGGRGSVLALPALGALASSPALKRQAWAALRALRRNGA